MLNTAYGAASQLDFNNEAKWVTVRNVPLLDEHSMTDQSGAEVAYVDAKELERIAANNNKRLFETGDPAPITIGHTSDDPRAPERPVIGYAVNFRVKPFRNGRYAIYADYKVRRKFASAVEDFPRRSVELWWSKRELDPIALLGGTTPERDLGVVVRRARLKGVALLGSTTPGRDLGIVVRYDRKSAGTVLGYEMNDEPDDFPSPTQKGPSMFDDSTDYDGLDENGRDPDDAFMAKVVRSKPWRQLESKIDEIYEAITGGGDGGGDEYDQGGGDMFAGRPGGASDQDLGQYPDVGFEPFPSGSVSTGEVAPDPSAGNRPAPGGPMSARSAAAVADRRVRMSRATATPTTTPYGFEPQSPMEAFEYANALARGESQQSAARYARSGGSNSNEPESPQDAVAVANRRAREILRKRKSKEQSEREKSEHHITIGQHAMSNLG